MATSNPMATTYSALPLAVSKKTFTIAGILTTVYGLDDLNQSINDVACLWLLHPRLQTQSCMEPLAASNINEWNARLQRRKGDKASIGLVAVSFDQRNHGSREVDQLANQTWRSGNETHAQDMFSIFHGTAVDVSLLITYISSYIFPTSNHTITTNLVCGVSLGGHCAWHCILHDARITTAIVVIGCPDYFNLMSDRARLSKLDTWTKSSPPGSSFLGSKDFPPGLVEAVKIHDPAAIFLGKLQTPSDNDMGVTSKCEEKSLSTMKSLLQGKRILNLSGGADKLVPYKCAEPFMRWLEKANVANGQRSEWEMVFEDIIFEGVGHELTSSMVTEVVRFVTESLEISAIDASVRQSKI